MSSLLNSSATGPRGLKNTGYEAVSTLSPEKASLYQQLMGGSRGGIDAGLSNLTQMAAGGNEDYWRQLEAPALRQFGQLQGNIASRFSGMGSGARRSSGFQNTMEGASTDLSERLQSNRMGLQQQAIRDLLGLSQTLMGTEDMAFLPKKKPWWQELLGSLAGGVGTAGGMLGGLFGGKSLGLLGGS